MGMTIGEKIIARAAKVDQVKAGEIHTIEVDRLMSNDGTTHLTIDMYHNQLKHPKIADKDKLVFIMDHNVPAENPKTAAAHRKMRNFAKEHQIKLYEGKGVCHQIMVENHVCPGEFIMGADSHTLYIRSIRSIRYRNRMYRLLICDGDRTVLGISSRYDPF